MGAESKDPEDTQVLNAAARCSLDDLLKRDSNQRFYKRTRQCCIVTLTILGIP
jgi:hypothetical protein